MQITKHWSNNEKPEMTLEKLQLIATACAGPEFKVGGFRIGIQASTLVKQSTSLLRDSLKRTLRVG